MVPAAQCREAGEGQGILMVAVALITQGNADILAMVHDYILFCILWAANPQWRRFVVVARVCGDWVREILVGGLGRLGVRDFGGARIMTAVTCTIDLNWIGI